MVKVTIEHDGKTRQYEGNLFLGQISTSRGCEVSARSMIVGSGNPQAVTKTLQCMVIESIKRLSEDRLLYAAA